MSHGTVGYVNTDVVVEVNFRRNSHDIRIQHSFLVYISISVDTIKAIYILNWTCKKPRKKVTKSNIF